MPAASGMLSLPRTYLAATVAASTTFQAWTGTANPPDALARIAFEEAPASGPFPITVVGWNAAYSRDKVATGVNHQYEGHGTLGLFFRDQIAGGASLADAQNAFENNVGGVIADMEQLAGQAGYLDITSIRFDDNPKRPEWQEAQGTTLGDFFEVLLLVEFSSL